MGTFKNVMPNKRARKYTGSANIMTLDRIQERIPVGRWQKFLYKIKKFAIARRLLGGKWVSFIQNPGTPDASLHWKWQLPGKPLSKASKFSLEDYDMQGKMQG
jgi:hypothetical protein